VDDPIQIPADMQSEVGDHNLADASALAGGGDQRDAILQWASQCLPPEQIHQFNEDLDNPTTSRDAFRTLQRLHGEAVREAASRASVEAGGFASRGEYLTALETEGHSASVMRKLANTSRSILKI